MWTAERVTASSTIFIINVTQRGKEIGSNAKENSTENMRILSAGLSHSEGML